MEARIMTRDRRGVIRSSTRPPRSPGGGPVRLHRAHLRRGRRTAQEGRHPVPGLGQAGSFPEATAAVGEVHGTAEPVSTWGPRTNLNAATPRQDAARRRFPAPIRDSKRRWRTQSPTRPGARPPAIVRIRPELADRQRHRRSVQAGRTYRRRGDGGGLHRGAEPAGETEGGAEADPGGDRFGNLLARFESERQALAMMDHPNIAKVFDADVRGGDPSSSWSWSRGSP